MEMSFFQSCVSVLIGIPVTFDMGVHLILMSHGVGKRTWAVGLSCTFANALIVRPVIDVVLSPDVLLTTITIVGSPYSWSPSKVQTK